MSSSFFLLAAINITLASSLKMNKNGTKMPSEREIRVNEFDNDLAAIIYFNKGKICYNFLLKKQSLPVPWSQLICNSSSTKYVSGNLQGNIAPHTAFLVKPTLHHCDVKVTGAVQYVFLGPISDTVAIGLHAALYTLR
ncbi:hypothetical protein COCON_G00051640 [Conger conger]|uniref:Uncharacterized protein n=1 Tax=Conger conger TaxID=82655 RepID=A0A9Q1I5M2_CONCO|nr:hypothetical protein COCON_G00051640 [Conger conger]